MFEEFDLVEIPKGRKGRVMKELAEEQSKDKTLKHKTLKHCRNLADKKDKWTMTFYTRLCWTTYRGK